jgi:hypothetical protein
MTVTVLMVAEKPSICTSIATALSRGQMQTRGRTPPIHEFQGTFQGKPAMYRSRYDTFFTAIHLSNPFQSNLCCWTYLLDGLPLVLSKLGRHQSCRPFRRRGCESSRKQRRNCQALGKRSRWNGLPRTLVRL